jgi:ribosome-binding ATPase YchF (GTP1/OBG family)
MGLDADEMALIKPLHLITAKPAMYVANVSTPASPTIRCWTS